MGDIDARGGKPSRHLGRRLALHRESDDGAAALALVTEGKIGERGEGTAQGVGQFRAALLDGGKADLRGIADRLGQTDAARHIGDGRKRPIYEIIAGERRFRAAKLAGLDSVPVLVRDVPNEAAAAMALIENIQREDLNPLEEAQGLQRLVREFGLTHEQAAQAVGRSRSAASNLLRLLNLAEPVQQMLMAGDIDMGHARALLPLDKALQITTANEVIGKKLNVRDTEKLVAKVQGQGRQTPLLRVKGDKSRDVVRLEEELSDLLAAAVQINVRRKTRHGEQGDITIGFGSLDELNGLIDRLRGGQGEA